MGSFHMLIYQLYYQPCHLYNVSLLFLGQWLLLWYLLNLFWSKISHAFTYNDTGAILGTQFHQIVMNCFLLLPWPITPWEALVWFCLLIIPILPLIQQTWIGTEGLRLCFLSWTSLNSSAFDSYKHFSISSVTECHLSSTVTYFVLDKPLLTSPTQIVKWEGSAEPRDHNSPWIVGIARRQTAAWE